MAGQGQYQGAAQVGTGQVNTPGLVQVTGVPSTGNPTCLEVTSPATLSALQTVAIADSSASGTPVVGLALTPTLTQSGTAGYTTLLINNTETSTGSGARRAIDVQLAGTSVFRISTAGNMTTAMSSGSAAASSGGPFVNLLGVSITPTITQTGTAGYSALLINPTETSVGSGLKYLINAAVASTTKWALNDNGVMLPNVLDTMTYATTISLDPTLAEVHETTTINATGNATINAASAGTPGQRMTVIVVNDATSGKTITFGTNFRPSATLVGTTSKAATVSFISDGTSWFEVSRATGL